MIPAPLPHDAPQGIYIHIPFCSHICPYCDFTTYAGKEAQIPRYVDNLTVDIARQARSVASREVASIFIGGGTPSLLDGDQMRRVVDACVEHFHLLPGCEISVETNPNSLTLPLLQAYREAGINRVSIGAQTMDRRGLRRLGRQHEASDVITALEHAHSAGFERISVDAIFGWPGQSLETWRQDLDTLLNQPRAPNHLSLYSLIVEPGTPYADAQARGILHIPDDDATAGMYELAMDMLAEAGWTHYEIANWSHRPNDHSRHNALYWQHGDYLGIGAGAHGHLNGIRSINHLLPEQWCTAVEQEQDTIANREEIDVEAALIETFLMGLRLVRDGISSEAFIRRHGVSIEELTGANVSAMVEIGMIEQTPTGIRLTRRGAMLANDVIARVTEFDQDALAMATTGYQLANR